MSQLSDCKRGNHALKEIYRAYGAFNDESIKWCIVCGAVVIDAELDDRVYPGKVRKMELPKVLDNVKS